MITALETDRKDAVRIIANTFEENPSVNIVIGSSGNRSKKINRLAEYAFLKALNKQGAFFSSNKKGVALCFSSEDKRTSIRAFWAELKLAGSIPISKVLETLKREAYLKKHRYTDRHLYFWFLGVEKNGEGAVYELKNEIYLKADTEQLPIILETSVLRNKTAYERYGFKVYHEWEDSGDGHTLWFMIRTPIAEELPE